MSAAAPTSNIDADALMKMSLLEIMQKGIDPCDSKVKSLVDEYYKAHFTKEEEDEDSEEEDDADEEEELDDDDEAGLMDYRHNDISIIEKDGRFTVTIQFSFDQRDECDLPTPEDFEDKWCASYDAKEIAEETLSMFTIIDAYWTHNKLTMIVDNMDGSITEEELLDDLENQSLEDGQFEGCPGDGFWVVSVADLKAAIDE